MLLQMASATLAPSVLNPLNIHPLSALLSTLVDFERVRGCEELQLFISATNVRTGKGRNFRREELHVEHVLASACLPQMFAPVQVDGEAWWDGSFVGNPPLAPLVDPDLARDILLIQNNPVARQDLPFSMADVHNRANEIAFNISMMREVSAIQNLAAVLDEEDSERVRALPVRMHLISATDVLRDLSISSKFNLDWTFIQRLYDLGQGAAGHWLDTQYQHVGVRSTLDPAYIHASESV